MKTPFRKHDSFMGTKGHVKREIVADGLPVMHVYVQFSTPDKAEKLRDEVIKRVNMHDKLVECLDEALVKFLKEAK